MLGLMAAAGPPRVPDLPVDLGPRVKAAEVKRFILGGRACLRTPGLPRAG